MELKDHSVGELLDAIGAKVPTPGGGAVASLIGAIAAALAQMVVNYSKGKTSFAEHEALHREALTRLREFRERALALAEDDEEAYGVLNALWKLD